MASTGNCGFPIILVNARVAFGGIVAASESRYHGFEKGVLGF